MAAPIITATRSGKPLRINYQAVPTLDREQLDTASLMQTARRLLLLSDPGAGKTVTALHALMLVADDNPATKTLIVCPPIAVDTWVRWTASMYRLHERDCAIEVLAKGNSPVTIGTTVLIVPHSLLSRANPVMLHRIKAWGYDVFINDESDGMNGWTSQRTRAAFGEKFDSGLSSAATYRWMLTGTALPRYNDGFYPVLRNLFPFRLANYHVKEAENFLNTFTTRETVKFGKMRLPKKQVSGSRNNKLLNRILFSDEDGFPCAVRIKLKLDAPLSLEAVDLDFPLSDELRQLEEELEAVKVEQGDRIVDPRMATALRKLGEETAPHVLADILADMADKRASGDKTGMLVLYWHTSVGEAIARGLTEAGYRVAMMNGSTKQDADAVTEAAFNAGKLDFVVGQIKAMGVAINLQENCCDVRFAEDSFSDAANQQAYQRVYRRGQRNPTVVSFYRAVRTGLADMKPRVAEKKRKGAHEVLDGHLKV